MEATAFLKGIGLGGSLIIAIGSQNAYLLRQALKEQDKAIAATEFNVKLAVDVDERALAKSLGPVLREFTDAILKVMRAEILAAKQDVRREIGRGNQFK